MAVRTTRSHPCAHRTPRDPGGAARRNSKQARGLDRRELVQAAKADATDFSIRRGAPRTRGRRSAMAGRTSAATARGGWEPGGCPCGRGPGRCSAAQRSHPGSCLESATSSFSVAHATIAAPAELTTRRSTLPPSAARVFTAVQVPPAGRLAVKVEPRVFALDDRRLSPGTQTATLKTAARLRSMPDGVEQDTTALITQRSQVQILAPLPPLPLPPLPS